MAKKCGFGSLDGRSGFQTNAQRRTISLVDAVDGSSNGGEGLPCFQVHGVDAAGEEAPLRAGVLPEAAAVSGPALKRALDVALQTGGISPTVWPSASAARATNGATKRQKNDATDAGAICVAVPRVNMRLVPTRTPEQQSCLMLHRTRHKAHFGECPLSSQQRSFANQMLWIIFGSLCAN
jgi:hypothetical protein